MNISPFPVRVLRIAVPTVNASLPSIRDNGENPTAETTGRCDGETHRFALAISHRL